MSHRFHPSHFRSGFSLSPSLCHRAPGTSITMSQNPSSAITSYQIFTCSGGKQVYNGLHVQRALLFLNHCQSTKIKCIWSFEPVTELVPAKSNGRHPFPQGIHCLVGKKNTEATTSNLMFPKLAWSWTNRASLTGNSEWPLIGHIRSHPLTLDDGARIGRGASLGTQFLF